VRLHEKACAGRELLTEEEKARETSALLLAGSVVSLVGSLHPRRSGNHTRGRVTGGTSSSEPEQQHLVSDAIDQFPIAKGARSSSLFG